VSLVSHRTAKG